MNCKYCGASMKRQRSPNPDEVWFQCCNNKCQFEEFFKRSEFEKKEMLLNKGKKPVTAAATGPKICPRCAGKMSFDENRYICMKCGKMI